jgi:hypothetical protein
MVQEEGGRDQSDGRRQSMTRAAYRELDDRGLIDAMRRSDEHAIDEFLVRHQRLLYDRVGRWGVRLLDVEDCITDVLEDVAVLIVNGRIRPTRSLAAYVVKVFRVTVARRAIADDQHRRAESDAADDTGGLGERAIASTVSEGTLRASRGLDWQPLPIPGAIARLATMLDESVTDEERRVLSWLSNFVAQRDISEWLGLSYAAGTQRIWRLRERLRVTAKCYADRFDSDEQVELTHFFRRMEHSGEPRPARGTRRGASTEETLDEGA